MNYHVQTVGGIGDILLYMLKPGTPLGYFPALQARGDTTVLEVHANTDAADALIATQPHVDYWRFRGKTLKYDTSMGLPTQLLNRWDGLEWSQPHIHLNEGERHILKTIGKEPYVAVHLAASRPEKVPAHFEHLLWELRKACVRTVLLGCESTDNDPSITGNRVAGYADALKRAPTVTEWPPHTGLVQDHCTVPPYLRLHVALAMCARKFIGTLSCFNCAAQLAAVPSFVIVDRSIQEPNVYRMMERNRALVRPWNIGTPVSMIYKEAVEWARR